MPCSKHVQFCDAVIEVISANPSVSDLIILGDFNQPSTTWNDLSLCTPNDSAQSLIDVANIFYLSEKHGQELSWSYPGPYHHHQSA